MIYKREVNHFGIIAVLVAINTTPGNILLEIFLKEYGFSVKTKDANIEKQFMNTHRQIF